MKRSGALRDEAVLKFVNDESICARLLLISGTKDSMAPSDKMNTLYNKIKLQTISFNDNGTQNTKSKNKSSTKTQSKSKSKAKSKNKEEENETKTDDNDVTANDKEIKCVLKWIEGGDHSLKVGKRHPLGMEKVHRNVINIISEFCFA